MSGSLKIAIIGDYNFSFNAHHATNLSLDHAGDFLEIELNYYWIKINEAIKYKPIYFDQFDGIWIAPGPYQNPFFLNGIFKLLLEHKSPKLITGEAFKTFIEFLIALNNLNPFSEKLISENLVDGNNFERVTISPISASFEKLYDNFSKVELTSSRFSMYPKLIEQLKSKFIDIEVVNQFDDPEIISLVDHDFFVACAFCPQISSTRDIPHPLVYTFLKAAEEIRVLNA
jgi:CTP synthase (UTP-ammonia lyase)